MCYLKEYTCTVRCLNTELNVSQAMNGTIQSLRPYGDQCRVMACEVVGEIGDGPMATASHLGQGYPTILGVAAAIIGIGLVVIGYYYVCIRKTEDPLGPQTKDKKRGDP